MAQSIRISDDLYAMAQSASQALSRPLAQQMEYWARLGAALDAAGLSTPKAMELLGHSDLANQFLSSALNQRPDEEHFAAELRKRHRKDIEDVAAGRRSARSLLMFQQGDLKGYNRTRNPESEFELSGKGWDSPPARQKMGEPRSSRVAKPKKRPTRGQAAPKPRP